MADPSAPPPVGPAAPPPVEPALTPPVEPAATPPVEPAKSRRLLESVPAWVQAIVAVLTLVVTVFGIGFAVTRDDPGAQSGAEVSLASSAVGDTISGSGSYLRLRPTNQEIYLLVQLDGASSWTPLEVALEPTRIDEPTGTQDGRWSAEAPVGATSATFLPVIMAAGSMGVSDTALDELRADGPDARGVVAFGEPVEVSS